MDDRFIAIAGRLENVQQSVCAIIRHDAFTWSRRYDIWKKRVKKGGRFICRLDIRISNKVPALPPKDWKIVLTPLKKRQLKSEKINWYLPHYSSDYFPLGKRWVFQFLWSAGSPTLPPKVTLARLLYTSY